MNKKNFTRLWQVIFSAVLSVCLFAVSAGATVTFDNSSSQGNSDTIIGLTTLTWSHTVNTCSNCALYVGVSTFTQTNFPTARVQSVNYGSQSLTVVGRQVSPFSANGNSAVELFRLIAPTAGTATITVNFAIAVNYAVGGANSFNSVSQTTPNSAFVSASGTSDSAIVSASDAVAGDLILDAISANPNAVNIVPQAAQTERYNGREFFKFAFDVGAGSTKTPTGSSTTMSWLLTNSNVWALGAVTLKQFVSTASLASISGQVRTADEQPIPFAVVTLQNLETGAEFQMQTDAKGKYFFDGLETARIYRVSIAHSRYGFSPSEQILSLTQAVEHLDFIGERQRRK